MNQLLLSASRFGYEQIARRLIFRMSAQDAHQRMMKLLARLDGSNFLCAILSSLHQQTFESQKLTVGGVALSHPFILAAGLVKGEGFQTEAEALAAVQAGKNIIPGWRAVPPLVGLVEFGSFTRHPRLGNPSVVLWRDEAACSTQNRVGLKNPGATAAAAFLARNRRLLPQQFGINVAVSPGVNDPDEEISAAREAFGAFLEQGIFPAWFTLNLSCPNTEDDPGGHQTENQTRRLCRAVVDRIAASGRAVPLWVKIGPELSAEQYAILIRVFADVGVKAVVATNTLPRPTPNDPQVIAGVGGGSLRDAALEAVRHLAVEKIHQGYPVDVIGCGGVLDGCSYHQFRAAGAQAVQYWSALVYRGPLAAAIIESEYKRGRLA